MNASEQILKSRDDKAPLVLSTVAGQVNQFSLTGTGEPTWLKIGGQVSTTQLRGRLEPWLTALFQSEHLSLLVGSGLSHAVHQIATDQSLPGMSYTPYQIYGTSIDDDARRSARAMGRQQGNLEDQFRAANELLRGLDILSASYPDTKASADALRLEISGKLHAFAESILQGEKALVDSPLKAREDAFNYLVSFLMSFGSRTGTRDRLHIFTTNYDRYIEAGAEIAGLHLMDRFVGSLSPIFRSSRLDVDVHYNPPGIRGEPRYLEGVAKLTKLHGSVDWFDTGAHIRRISLPFGAPNLSTYLSVPGTALAGASQLMIYPNAGKDRETAAYPYVDLFRDFAAAVSRPNSTLVCFGYSFGDEHINRMIADMLTIPSTHLVIISHGDPLGRIMAFYESTGRPVQMTIMVGNHLGDLKALVDNYLPKPSIDRTTFRMADLLKARWNVSAPDGIPPAGENVIAEGTEF